MAVVTQTVTPAVSYSPFEGMPEAQRMVSSVPRGIIRYASVDAVDAKPVNDDIRINVVGLLPAGFAYVLSSFSWKIIVDRAADFDDSVIFNLTNGIPNGIPPVTQDAACAFRLQDTFFNVRRVVDQSLGSLREMFPQPLVKTVGATTMSFTITASNGNNTVQAAGTQSFHMAFYQYELNQAVRFPLNSPVPVGIR